MKPPKPATFNTGTTTTRPRKLSGPRLRPRSNTAAMLAYSAAWTPAVTTRVGPAFSPLMSHMPELRQAVSSLEGLRSAVGRPLDMNREQKAIDAARVLRYLGTRDAALALVHFFERGREVIQNYIVAGLYGSPYREEVIAALREGLTAPDVAVTSNWIGASSRQATPTPVSALPTRHRSIHTAQAT